MLEQAMSVSDDEILLDEWITIYKSISRAKKYCLLFTFSRNKLEK